MPAMDRTTARWTELREDDATALQAFFEANPEYWRAVTNGAVPSDAARQVFADRPPADWAWERMWVMGARDGKGDLAAMVEMIEGLFAPSIWHVGLYVVAARLHRTGASAELYAALESWMRERGAQWVRLGVVVGNTAAERFWEKSGFVEVRRRYDIEVEGRKQDLRVLVKPLTDGAMSEYLAMVERDRGDDHA
jgi:GNAT superfamily N-acetyltransferase